MEGADTGTTKGAQHRHQSGRTVQDGDLGQALHMAPPAVVLAQLQLRARLGAQEVRNRLVVDLQVATLEGDAPGLALLLSHPLEEVLEDARRQALLRERGGLRSLGTSRLGSRVNGVRRALNRAQRGAV